VENIKEKPDNLNPNGLNGSFDCNGPDVPRAIQIVTNMAVNTNNPNLFCFD